MAIPSDLGHRTTGFDLCEGTCAVDHTVSVVLGCQAVQVTANHQLQNKKMTKKSKIVEIRMFYRVYTLCSRAKCMDINIQ